MLTVAAIPCAGYEKKLGAYIFQDHAWHRGRELDHLKAWHQIQLAGATNIAFDAGV